MDEMLDIDELLALHEDGDKAEGMEQEDQDLDVLREWEAEMEAKENRVKKCLFQEQSEVTIELEKEVRMNQPYQLWKEFESNT